MLNEPDFKVFYSDQPGHIRANANLPPEFVWTLTRLTTHAVAMDQYRLAIEKAEPGDWDVWNISPNANPVGLMLEPYGQYSRADSLKGSEQVVRTANGNQQAGLQGMGNPNLLPNSPNGGPVIMIQNGMKEVKEKKGLRGLGGWR